MIRFWAASINATNYFDWNFSNRRDRRRDNNLINIRKLIKPVETPERRDTDSQPKRQRQNP
jgi:hypothetical protein